MNANITARERKYDVNRQYNILPSTKSDTEC